MEIYKKYNKIGMRFCNIITGTKRPYNWDEVAEDFTQEKSDKSGIIKWSEKPLHFENVKNPGVLGGYGGFVIIDIDKNYNEAIKHLTKYLPLDTFIVESGKSTQTDKRVHIYYKIKDPDNFSYKKVNKYGEIIWFGGQCLGAGNIHPETKREYKIYSDNDIEEINAENLNNYLKDISEDEKIQQLDLIQVRKSEILKTILNNDKIKTELAKKQDIQKNDILFKNMAIFLYFNNDYEDKVYNFINKCKYSHSEFEGWFKKASSMSINENELKKWIIDYKLQGIFGNEDNYDGLDIVNENEVLEWTENNNYIIKNLIYENTINMIYAPPASFKSFFSLYLSMCLASGKRFFDMETKQSNVLYLDKENPKISYKNRYRGLLNGTGFTSKNNLFTYKSGDILDDKFILSLKVTIKKYNIKIIVLDTLHRFGDYNEDKADDLNRIYSTCFQPIAEELGCSVIFLHHTTKEVGKNRYRGSSDLEGMCDGVFLFERIEEKKLKTNIVKLYHKKNRHGKEHDVMTFNLEIESDDNDKIQSANFVIYESDKEENTKEILRSVIINYVREYEMNRRELIEKISSKLNYSDSSIDKTIKQLKEDKILMNEIPYKLNTKYRVELK